MRSSNKQLHPSLKKEVEQILVSALAELKSEEDIEKFLKDFFTEAELSNFSKRLAAAYWLKKGRSYANIKQNLKISSATIASIQTMMETAGFQKVLEKLEADEWASQWSEKIKRFIGSK